MLGEISDAHGVHARRPLVGSDPLPRHINEAHVDLKRLHHRLWSAHQFLPRRIDLKVTWPVQPLRSNPITGPSSLLRAGPPLCLASVLCRPRAFPRAGLSWPPGQPAAGRRIPNDRSSCSIPAPAMSSRHLNTGHHQGNTQTAPWLRTHPRARLCPADTHNLRFRCQRSTFRCLSSSSHTFVFSSLT